MALYRLEYQLAQQTSLTPSVLNRLYVIDASRHTGVYALNRDRRLKALAPLLLCYSRAHHPIVDQFGLGILCVVSTGNTLLQSGFKVAS